MSRSRRIESDARRSLESSKDKIVSDIEQEKLQKEISGLKTRVQERDSQIDSVSHERDQMQKMIKDLVRFMCGCGPFVRNLQLSD